MADDVQEAVAKFNNLNIPGLIWDSSNIAGHVACKPDIGTYTPDSEASDMSVENIGAAFLILNNRKTAEEAFQITRGNAGWVKANLQKKAFGFSLPVDLIESRFSELEKFAGLLPVQQAIEMLPVGTAQVDARFALSEGFFAAVQKITGFEFSASQAVITSMGGHDIKGDMPKAERILSDMLEGRGQFSSRGIRQALGLTPEQLFIYNDGDTLALQVNIHEVSADKMKEVIERAEGSAPALYPEASEMQHGLGKEKAKHKILEGGLGELIGDMISRMTK